MERAVGTYKQYPHWAKGPARVEGGYVVLDEARATPYYIFEPHDLLFDLLDVYRPNSLDPRDVTRFVRRYGLLYHGEEKLGSGRCRELLSRWHDELASLNMLAQIYIDLVESVERGPTQRMRQTFALMAARASSKPTDQEYLEAVSVFLAEGITEGMRDAKAGLVSTCGLDVQPKGPRTFLLSQLPTSLIAAAYSQFAFLLANKAPMSICPGCGRLFVPTSGRQKYHHPSCASTSRWRRWKSRQAET